MVYNVDVVLKDAKFTSYRKRKKIFEDIYYRFNSELSLIILKKNVKENSFKCMCNSTDEVFEKLSFGPLQTDLYEVRINAD